MVAEKGESQRLSDMDSNKARTWTGSHLLIISDLRLIGKKIQLATGHQADLESIFKGPHCQGHPFLPYAYLVAFQGAACGFHSRGTVVHCKKLAAAVRVRLAFDGGCGARRWRC